MAVGDLNGDGIDDVAAANHRETGKTYLAISGKDGGGAYTGHVQSDVSHPTNSHWVGIASLNPVVDAHLDLVIATESQLIVKFGDGTGATFTDLILPWSPAASEDAILSIGDLDGNGAPDLVALGSFFLNNGNGTFGPVQTYNPALVSGNQMSDLKVCDIDGDGASDLIMTTIDEFVHVFRGNGTGGFAEPPFIHDGRNAGQGSAEIACHDFNGDGVLDFVAGGYEVGYDLFLRGATAEAKIIEIGGGGGEEEEEEEPIDVEGVYGIDFGDIDGDGEDEMIVSDDFFNQIKIFKLLNPFEE
jgi:hypothetical protein